MIRSRSVEDKVGGYRRRKEDCNSSGVHTGLGELANLAEHEMSGDVYGSDNSTDDNRFEKSEHHTPPVFLWLLINPCNYVEHD